ncbi:hypothetical protein [Metabacillus halosaccharovorans]|uniref:hypothetical protein n=1 Tax=Metabacillus halosaccharovorans TaxID=930124 RepID=UPI001C1FFC1D|nr:hypothetical protein [Metabacillus halosaccharovorans]MBU7595728.1 hypothetical protein [Metabacillus halosaccharovorans]
MIKLIFDKVSKIRKADSEDKIKIELYGVVSSFLFSKEIFKRNSDIKVFLENSNDKFKEIKPYVYVSKTLIIGRILREIEKESKLFNYNFALDIKSYLEDLIKQRDLLEEDNKKSEKLKNNDINKINYTDSLFDRFKRGQ